MSATLKPCPSSRQPMEAEARPLPRDDTTPPVTKMYFVGTLAPSSFPLARTRGGQERAYALEVVRRVHRDSALALHGDDPDGHPVEEGAQLLETLRLLEGGGGQRRQAQERLAPVHVEADMLACEPAPHGLGGRAAAVAGGLPH